MQQSQVLVFSDSPVSPKRRYGCELGRYNDIIERTSPRKQLSTCTGYTAPKRQPAQTTRTATTIHKPVAGPRLS